MCNQNRNTETKINPEKIVARIIKGFAFLPINDVQRAEYITHIRSTVHSDYDTLSPADFARRYVEWIPTFMAAAAMEVNNDEVTRLIAIAGEARKNW